MNAKVLIIGSGSREHALAWKISQSELVKEILISPGNAGTHLEDKAQNIELPFANHSAIADWCKENDIDLVVIGPEAPLADGLSDELKKTGVACFGPSKLAAQIESSKVFSKMFLDRHGIPTARWKSFSDADDAISFIKACEFECIVVKATGLCAGKGVVVAASKEEAIEAVQEMIEMKIFGDAGSTVIIEEKLKGEEISVFAFSDGTNVACFPPAQDFKRAYDGDKGPNTGGMGAFCPVMHIQNDISQFVECEVLQKTVQGMKSEGYPFVGLLYAGLMLTEDGPKVLEFNCRFGDPETQVVLPLLKSDLYTIMKECCNGNLLNTMPSFDNTKFAVTVVLASGGYPKSYDKGITIHGLDIDKQLRNVKIFHAGTTVADNRIVTNGGRVLSVTGLGSNIHEARSRSYEALHNITFHKMFYRKDIGQRASGLLRNLSYYDSGVDIDAGASLVEAIKPLAKATLRSGCMSDLGGFGALFDLHAAGYLDPIIVSGTDGVGTKLKIAHACLEHTSVGIDLVAMCVNDIVAQGAEPLFFLDYYACGRLDINAAKQVVTGIAQGCALAGCALLGGETAEMPGMYQVGDYDIAGFAVGAVERSQVLPKLATIQPGDSVIGLPSSGIHSNGFSLVRKIVRMAGYEYSSKSPFSKDETTIGEALLTPTKIYVKPLLSLIKSGKIKAFAHITGGGLMENIPRVIPSSVSCILDSHSWEVFPIFGWIAEIGNITPDEMLRTFNCGLGGVLIVDSKNTESVLRSLNDCGEKACSVGVIGHAVPDKPQVQVIGFATSLQMSIRSFHIHLPMKKVKREKMKVGVLISGSGTNLQALIDHALKPESSAEIVLVISNVDDVFGLHRAARAGIPTKVINHRHFKKRLDFDMEVLSALNNAGVELICLAGFMRILTGTFISKWLGRLINIHPSLLPSFKGIDAHKQALAAGVRISGCTAHFVVEEVDAGAIIAQEAVPVLPNDTIETLQERVKLKEWEVFPKAMELVASGIVQIVDGLIKFS